jgi:hypothetical protein
MPDRPRARYGQRLAGRESEEVQRLGAVQACPSGGIHFDASEHLKQSEVMEVRVLAWTG